MSPAFRVARSRLAVIVVFFVVVWWLAYAFADQPIIRLAAMRGLFAGLFALILSSALSIRRAFTGKEFNSVLEISFPVVVFIVFFLVS